MDLKGLSGGLYEPLTPQNIETIHNTALTILEKTGFKFEDGLDETIDLLEANGASVDKNRARVFLPRNRMSPTAQSSFPYSVSGRRIGDRAHALRGLRCVHTTRHPAYKASGDSLRSGSPPCFRSTARSGSGRSHIERAA